MTRISYEKYAIPSANLGEDSALADIHVNSYIRANINVSEKVAGEEAKYIGKGMISTLLPYRITDGYDRSRIIRSFRAAVLENEYIKAVFLPELGGRLWSLVDKRDNRELLYKNDVFQPANLALRNAWFSGGVEWNVGIKGHNPLTCAPLFCQTVYNKNDQPVLRMYEFERIREVVYVIEATLDKDTLCMNITIENTKDSDVYMYWWSNIAVPETPKTRVIVPADNTFYCAYTDGAYFLDKTAMPCVEGKDITYASSSNRSRDFFFDIADGRDKWIATANEEGKGLLQSSTAILKGRKLFVWGQHDGGRHWNDWLSDKAGPYVEIQAGLLKTQLEHFVMKANSTINWQERYSAFAISPDKAHGEFFEAVACAQKEVDKNVACKGEGLFDIVREGKIEQFGSGWGAVENKLRGERISNICLFPDESITDEQKAWSDLIDGKALDFVDPDIPTPSYVVGEKWLELMLAYPKNNWNYYNHLGVIYYALGDIDKAEESFTKSFTLTPNAWAYRNLAQIKKNIKSEYDVALRLMQKAVEIKPDYTQLIVEYAYACMSASAYGRFVSTCEKLPQKQKENGRVRMLLGACLNKIGDTEGAIAIINKDLVVDDIKEGEYALSAIWTDVYAQKIAKEENVDAKTLTAEEVLARYPLPIQLDYRMH